MIASPALASLISFDVGGHRSYGKRDINSDINSYMNNSKAELTTSICYIEKLSKTEIPIYNSKVPDTARRKTRRRRRTQVIFSCKFKKLN